MYKELDIDCCYNCEHYYDWIDGQDCKLKIVDYAYPLGLCDKFKKLAPKD